MSIGIKGTDDREVITNFNEFPYSTVTTVDVKVNASKNGYGSGITIGPNHVLTVGHNAYIKATGTQVSTMRTTTSANEDALKSRKIGEPGDPVANVTNINFLANYDTTKNSGDDIALLTTSDAPLAANEVIGLIAFVDTKMANKLTIDTAGYPGDNVSSNIPGKTGAKRRDLVRAPKATEAPGESIANSTKRIFNYSEDIDSASGQSGSGVWHILDGDSDPRVLGVHVGAGIKKNVGKLITKDDYDEIVKQMESDSGTGNANDLPENAIIGSDNDDYIVGSYRKERILGNDGDDTLLGGGADDRLEGGEGTDQALFSDIFTNYDYTITDPANFTDPDNPGNPAFEFTHARGTQTDGTDSTKDIEFGVFEYVDLKGGEDNKPDGTDDDGNLFFVPLQVDPDDPTKLKDGPKITPEEDILDDQGDKIGTLTVESPAWMFDGDVKYTLNIGSDLSIVYNLAYIVDSSGSMRGNKIVQTKAAYQDLTEYLINEGIANNTDFGVVDFDTSARLFAPLDAQSTISTVNGLGAGGSTYFDKALVKAIDFYQDPARNNNATNVAYFLSDGVASDAGMFTANANTLKQLTEVRAFGIGNADLDQLRIIDSDGKVPILKDPSDLRKEFKKPPIDKNTIDHIDVKLDGKVISTITPDKLEEDTLGLKFEGTIEGLEVTRTAENEITFDLVFNNGTPTTSLDYKITTGQEQVTTKSKNGTIIITFSANQADFTDPAPAPLVSPLMSESLTNSSLQTQSLTREIIGNDLDNTIQVNSGNNTIYGNGGDDRFILLGGINLVDGGYGIDTVEISQTQAQAGGVSKSGNVVSIGTDHTLVNVEFIEFTDVRLAIDGSGFTPTPTLSLANNSLSITEVDNGSSFATFTVNLSNTTTEDVVVDFSTRSDDANAGTDFVATTGQLTILAGQSSGDISVEILGDTEVEGDESLFLDLSAVSGGTFVNGATRETAQVNILDDDSVIDIFITGDDLTVIEGNPNSPSTLTLTLDRFGSLNGTDTVEVEILAGGNNPAQASDLVNGFSSSQITFAPGEDTKTIDIPINPDQAVESDETFAVKLTSVSGSASVPNQDIIFTILDDDQSGNIGILVEGTNGKDTLKGGDGNDTLRGFGDQDLLDGGAGADLMEGGNGRDTYIVDNTGDVVRETNSSKSGGRDLVKSSVNFTLPNNVESLTLTGNDAIDGTGNNLINIIHGNDQDNYLRGHDGNDKLIGKGGADTLDGGAGNDQYTVDGLDTLIDSAGMDSVYSSIDWTLADGFERLFLNGSNPLNGTGNSLDNTLLGNKGNNILEGKDGNDTFNGKKGNDTLIGGDGKDTLTGDIGADTFLYSAVSHSTVMHPDYIVDFESGADVIQLANMGITSFSQLDITTSGGKTQIASHVNDFGLLLKGELTLSTNDFVFESNPGNNAPVINSIRFELEENKTSVGTIQATDADGDTLTYSKTGGADGSLFQIASNTGLLTFISAPDFENALDSNGDNIYQVEITANDGIDDSQPTTISVTVTDVDETVDGQLIIGTPDKDTLIGGVGNDTLQGNGNNDSLDGGAGADLLEGGNGNDVYIVDQVGDIVSETTSGKTGGTDLVKSAVDFTLPDNVENLDLTDFALNGTGNSLKNQINGNEQDNYLIGYEGNDRLVAGGGTDTLDGGKGNDSYVIDVNDTVIDSGGKDTIFTYFSADLADFSAMENITLYGNGNFSATGNNANNKLTGNNANNHLIGQGGADQLDGKDGADILDGGAGNDIYTVDNVGDTIIDSSGTDTVIVFLDWVLDPGLETLLVYTDKDVDATGNSLDNKIVGRKGQNTLVGGDGDDILIGGEGNDTLTGGNGLDSFQFNDDIEGIDTITDYNVADDTIWIYAKKFSRDLTRNSAITPAQFNLGNSATTTDHRFIYDSSNGALWFDADGTGSTAQLQLATLTTGLGMTNNDIYVI